MYRHRRRRTPRAPEWLCPSYGPTDPRTCSKLKLVPYLDCVEALADARQAQWEIEGSASLRVNEKREAHGYPRVDEGDIVVLAHATTPALVGKEKKSSQQQQQDAKPKKMNNR